MEELLVSKTEAVAFLKTITWEEGKTIPIIEAPYRYRIIVHCSHAGRQTTEFANGFYPYFCNIELVSGAGNQIKAGANMVPILPNGKFIMVVEQRPAQGVTNPSIAIISGEEIDLKQFGEYSSLEFPGGAVENNETIKAGFLRELTEETGIEGQKATLFMQKHPIYSSGSEIRGQGFYGVVHLSGFHHEKKVETDGGLVVFSLSEEEIKENIKRGVICSGQAAWLPWSFYKQAKSLGFGNENEFFSRQEVKIIK